MLIKKVLMIFSTLLSQMLSESVKCQIIWLDILMRSSVSQSSK